LASKSTLHLENNSPLPMADQYPTLSAQITGQHKLISLAINSFPSKGGKPISEFTVQVIQPVG